MSRAIRGIGFSALMVLSACSALKKEGSDYVGQWAYSGSIGAGDPSPRSMAISENGESFLIALTQNNGGSGGTIGARYQGGMLVTDNAFAGSLSYVQENGTITFMGNSYTKQ